MAGTNKIFTLRQDLFSRYIEITYFKLHDAIFIGDCLKHRILYPIGFVDVNIFKGKITDV